MTFFSELLYRWVFEPLISAPTYDLNPITLILRMVQWWRGTDVAAESVEPGTL
jgi:hypothetical protein